MSFWSGKRVVVTGGAGFVGVHLTRRLRDEGAFTVVMDDFSRGQNLVEGIEYEARDAGDMLACARVFQGADAVFNLAAYVAGVLYNQAHALEMFERNMLLQTVPVRAAQTAGVPRFLQISSVCVYADGYNSPAREESGHAGEPDDSNSGYAWAKRMGERAVEWSGLPHAVIVRPSNLYGPHDYYDERAHVIPALIKKCLTDDVIRVHGTGEERREFLYVEDGMAGMMAVLEHGTPGAVYNLGTDGETCIPIRELVAEIQRMTRTGHKPVEFTGGNGGDRERFSDASRARADLGWRFKTQLADGLFETVAEYLSRANLPEHV